MVVLLLGSAPAVAGQCEASKLKAAATKTVKMAACIAKAVSKGTPSELIQPCLAATDEKFLNDIAKAEAKGSCDLSGDAATIQDAIAALIILVLPGNQLTDLGPSTCEANKWKATAKKAKAKLACHAKVETKGGAVDPECLSKAEDNFVKSFAKADLRAPCAGDHVAIEAMVDTLVDTLLAGLEPLDLCSIPGTPDFTPCDDHIACTGGEFCLGGVCGQGADQCETQDLCEPAHCDHASGECMVVPITCPPVVADDLNAQCNAANDPFPCCTGKGGGNCAETDRSAQCNAASDPFPCCTGKGTGNCACWRRFCDTGSGGCESVFDPPVGIECSQNECSSDPECDDSNRCTIIDSCHIAEGIASCQWLHIQCDDGRPCTVDSCTNPNVGCESRLQPPSIFCDDGKACTEDAYADTSACMCTHTPHDDACDDHDPCTKDVCDPAVGCVHPSKCDDNDPCTADSCDPRTHKCSHVKVDCTPCTSETGVNVCGGGICPQGLHCGVNFPDFTPPCRCG
jgi:hypothetical protein